MESMKVDLMTLKNEYVEYQLSIEDTVFVVPFEDYVTESGTLKNFCESFDKFIEKVYADKTLVTEIITKNFGEGDADVVKKLLATYETFS
jgi:hypothetical protein